MLTTKQESCTLKKLRPFNAKNSPGTKNTTAIITGLAVLFGCLYVTILQPRFLKAVALQSYDVITRQAAVPPQSDRIILIDIDNRSMRELGQWPWPRYLLARLLEKLQDAGVSVVAFDVVFPEMDRTSPERIAVTWQDAYGTNAPRTQSQQNLPDFDDLFAKQMAQGKTVLGCYLYLHETELIDPDALAAQQLDPGYKGTFLVKGKPDPQYLLQAEHLEISHPALTEQSETGFFNTIKDQDDIIRRTPLVAALGPYRIYPSLALQVLRLYLNEPRYTIVYDDEGVKGIKYIQLHTRIIPTDATGRLVLNFRNAPFRRMSALDILNGTADASLLNNSVAFIGTSAAGLRDMRKTPFHETEIPGVEIQATALDNMLAGDMLREPRWMFFATLVAMLLGGILLIAVVIRTRALLSVLVLIFCMVYPVAVSILLLKFFNLVVIPTPMILAWLLTYIAVTIVKYWQKEIVEEFNTRLRQANDNLEREIEIRKQTEEALRVARNQALEAAEAKSRFLANMSHEIRTPMNGVIGMTELALKTKLDTRQHNYLNKIRISAKALLRIINDILDFSKIEAGKLDIEQAAFQLCDVLEELADLFSDKAAAKGIELVIDRHPDVPSALCGDPLRLRQTLVNLTGNALKFTESGCVSITVECIEPRTVNEAVTLLFKVRDSGIGIPEEHLSKLFSSFTQVDGSTSRKYGGTGLGLAISRQLIELMGGTITVSSTFGEGTEFSAVLPFTQQPADAEPTYTMPPELTNSRILLCLSHPGTCLSVQHILTFSNLAFTELTQPPCPPALTWEQTGACILIDSDSWQNHPELQAAASRHPAPLILLTSSIAEQNTVPIRHSGAAAFIVRPVKPSELHQALLTATGHDDQSSQTAKQQDNISFTDRLSGLRLILAEDNLINQEVALENLHSVGISVDTATNGTNVLKLLQDDPSYDLILMDVQMPEMDGFETTQRIRKNILPPAATTAQDVSSIPIIAMTAHAMKGDMEKCIQAGMNDYLSKPIDPQKMFQVISRWAPDQKRLAERKSVGAQPADLTQTDSRSLPSTPSALLDLKAGLNRLNNNRTLYSRLLDDFSTSYANCIERITRALQQQDVITAAKQIHTLKGTAGNLSLKALQRAAAQAEIDIKSDKFADIDALMEPLSRSFSQTTETIAAFLQAEQQRTPRHAMQKEESDLSFSEYISKLGDLKVLLDAGSGDAVEVAESMEAAIRTHSGTKQAQNLLRDIRAFSFSEAGEMVKKMMAETEQNEVR